MATEEITISELELADEVLADMTLPVDTATETRAVTLKQLRAWLGSSLPTGFIIPAVGKISDERFTLLDGKTLSRAGTYEAFCNKVILEVQAGNWFACSEEEYAQDLSDFGQCGKFVVSNDYIRIPTITRFVGATVTLSEIGKTYKESLPNITGNVKFTTGDNGHLYLNATGAFTTSENISGNQAAAKSDGRNMRASVIIDASRSSSTYQDGAKVQPDHVKYPYYMVISTEGQTANVEIDINKVYEDLNIKANKNLSNLTAEGKSLASGFGMASRKKTLLTLGASGSIYTAPASGYFAVGIDGVQHNWITFEGTFQVTFVSPSKDTTWVRGIYPIAKGETVKINYGGTSSLTNYLSFYYAQGEQ